MRLAFLIFEYFPHGGLQRDCLAIAGLLRRRGHDIDLFAGRWQGPRPAEMAVRLVPPRGRSNHVRSRNFATDVAGPVAAGRYDAVVGFNRMPGLDCLYVADPCFRARHENRWGGLYRLTPRFRAYAALEAAVFAPAAGVEVLLLSEAQRAEYRRCYGTPLERLHLLPPVIAPGRRRPATADAIRAAMRGELGLAAEDRLVLLVGSRFRTKGLDRAIRAVAALPPGLAARTRLIAIGAGDAAPYERLAGRLGVADRVRILPGRDDIDRYLLAADLLVHPARLDTTGTVILEAVVAGLPVLCTAVCGYAEHVRRAEAGLVLPEPFRQAALDRALAEALTSPLTPVWARNGAAYGQTADLYRGRDVAAELVERIAMRRAGRPAPAAARSGAA